MPGEEEAPPPAKSGLACHHVLALFSQAKPPVKAGLACEDANRSFGRRFQILRPGLKTRPEHDSARQREIRSNGVMVIPELEAAKD